MSNSPIWAADREEVRLFPSAHITSVREAELRATAALLAAIRAVPKFGRQIVRLSGGSAGRLSCYTEVGFRFHGKGDQKPKELRPDGAIVSIRGKTPWVTFVEVKVGTAPLEQEQVEMYQRLAREQEADVLVTVSNQAARSDGSPPLNIDGRRIRVVHFSWDRLLSIAQELSRENRNSNNKDVVDDTEQKWILDEWIRYVDDENSRIIAPPDLGPNWGNVLRAAQANRLEQSAGELKEVARFWVGYLRKAAFRLRAKLGVDVAVRISRKDRDKIERQVESAMNSQDGTLNGTLRIPDAAGDISMNLILPSRKVQYIIRVAAPTEGRQRTRISWLKKHLKPDNLPSGDLKVVADWNVRRLNSTTSLHDYLEEPTRLCLNNEGVQVPKDASPRWFEIVWTRPFSKRRGKSGAPILDGVSQGLEDFYKKVVQDIERFVPMPPRIPATPEGPDGQTAAPEPNRQSGTSKDGDQLPTQPQ